MGNTPSKDGKSSKSVPDIDPETIKLYQAFLHSVKDVREVYKTCFHNHQEGQSQCNESCYKTTNNHKNIKKHSNNDGSYKLERRNNTIRQHITNVDEMTRSSSVLNLVITPKSTPPESLSKRSSIINSYNTPTETETKLLARFVWNLELMPPLAQPIYLYEVTPIPPEILFTLMEAENSSRCSSSASTNTTESAASRKLAERRRKKEMLKALTSRLCEMTNEERWDYQMANIDPLQIGIHYHDIDELEIATYFFSISAFTGNPMALHILAISARHGMGMESDMSLAVHLLQLSVRAAVREILLGRSERDRGEYDTNGVSTPPQTLERVISQKINNKTEPVENEQTTLALNKISTLKMDTSKKSKAYISTIRSISMDDSDELYNSSNSSSRTNIRDMFSECSIQDLTLQREVLSSSISTRGSNSTILSKSDSGYENALDSQILDKLNYYEEKKKKSKKKQHISVIPKSPRINEHTADVAMNVLVSEIGGKISDIFSPCLCNDKNCIHDSNMTLISESDSYNFKNDLSDCVNKNELRNQLVTDVQQQSQLTLTIFEIGVSFLHGWGVPRSKTSALYYLSLAAQLGDPDAQELVGDMHFRGIGTRSSKPLAAYWYRCAIRSGNKILGSQWVWKEKYDTAEDIRSKDGFLLNSPPGINTSC